MFPKLTSASLRVVLLGLCAVLCVLPAAADQDGPSPTDEKILQEARAIHDRAITLDTHVDIAGPEYATEKLDPGIDHPELRCDLVKMAAGGMDGVFLAVFVAQGKRDAQGYRQAFDAAMGKFDAIHRLTGTMYPDRCELATSPDDVQRIAAGGKRAIMIGIENGYVIGTDLGNLKRFYDLGARYITLCHNGHNQICDSCNPKSNLGDEESEHDGLSPFGREVVAEMNRLGIMPDVSHAGRKSFWDLVQVTKAPIIASHSGCRALCDHPRDLDDEQLKALAASGGVIQIVAYESFLRPPSAERRQAVTALAERLRIPLEDGEPKLSEVDEKTREQYGERLAEIKNKFPAATIKDYVDHIDHAVRVAGIDHVGIGSDFDGGAGVPGFQNHRESLNVTVELVRRGYSEEEIRKIWGGNLLRVWRETERVAAQLRRAAKENLRK
jgi:membrane dipeptidase